MALLSMGNLNPFAFKSGNSGLGRKSRFLRRNGHRRSVDTDGRALHGGIQGQAGT